MEYDEYEAIKFIRQSMPEDISDKYDDDEILNVIDIIWDYYEENGMLEISDNPPEDEIVTDSLIAYVTAMLKKDKLSPIAQDHIGYIVKGELDYEASLGF